MNSNSVVKSDKDEIVAKSYVSPRLVLYGNISEITQTVSPKGKMNDNAPKTGKDKT
jgi:hypothetical protein